MTLEESKKIVEIWGVYLEYTHGKLSIVFGPHIPESFLPFSSKTLEEALNIVAQHYHDMGDEDAMNILQSGIGFLTWYVDEEDAISRVAELFSNPEWRKTVIGALKKFQGHKARA